MPGHKLGCYVPGIDPVIFRSIEEMSLFKLLDEAKVKQVYVNIFAAEDQMML